MSQVVPKPKQRPAARGELFPQRSMGTRSLTWLEIYDEISHKNIEDVMIDVPS
jgi:hypothetical protein